MSNRSNGSSDPLAAISDVELRAAFRHRFSLKCGSIIDRSEDAAEEFVALLLDQGRERFAGLFLNGRNQMISSQILSEGTLTAASIYPRELVRTALELNASAVIVGHNHPSGSLVPSALDQQVTCKLLVACESVDILFQDHIIIADDGWYSFADHGDLALCRTGYNTGLSMAPGPNRM